MDTFVQLLPVLATILVALVMSVGMVVAGKLFSPRRSGAVKQMPYESGMDPIHDTRRRFDVRFYMVAIAFLIFDVELLFLYPWAVARTNPDGLVRAIGQHVIDSRTDLDLSFDTIDASASKANWATVEKQVVERTWIVFLGVMVFIVVLVLGFVYDWRKGLFQWR